ncbi:MAG TPA: FAD-binding protein, partial [Xanthobacteraceae bacterium]|nr:FAD-binding protein [Xanthobacteraceae bacterium]
MTDPLAPRSASEVEEAVRGAVADGRTLEILGHGSKRGVGRAAQWDRTLDLSALSGVTLYEPAELVLSAKAGTSIAEIEALIAASNQQLAFEPMDFGPIFGEPAGRGTLGGTLAANVSGPRRIKAGAARDHFLGFTAVSGRGETFKSGGRVVKNVTGYDLSKLMAGSWGTLAVLTDVTVKVLPRPETEETVVLSGLDETAAVRALNAALGSAAEVSGAAHAPAGVANRLGMQAGVAASGGLTALRLEGVPPSIAHRRGLLQSLLKPYSTVGVLTEQDSRTLWRGIRDVLPFAADDGGHERPLWRISTAPMQGPEVGRRIAAAIDAEFLYDWAGGLVWAQLPPLDDAGEKLVREAITATGGHATLVRAPAAVSAAVAVFDPPDHMTAALTKRVK